MAIVNLFSKAEGALGELLLKERDAILAYLEELAHLHTPVKLWCREEDRAALGAQVLKVEEESMQILLRLQRALPGDMLPKARITMVFPLGGFRFLAQVRFLTRGQYLEAYVSVPEAVRHAERRSKMRTRFGSREKATVTCLGGPQDLSRRQLGATGALLDLSLEGLCVRLERAVSTQDNSPLPVNASLFKPGDLLPVIRIEQLPFAPTLECSGHVAHIEELDNWIVLGICFDPPGEAQTQILAQVMSRRLPRFNQGYPIRERRPKEESAPAQASVQAPGEAGAEPLEGLSPEEADAAAFPHETPEQRAARILLVRKKAKRILLVMFDDLDRAILSSILKADGFEKIHAARNLLEATSHFKVFTLDIIIIEQNLGAFTAQEILTRLRKQGLCQQLPVVLLAAEVDMRLKIMAKAAQIDQIQKLPVDYPGELQPALLRLLNL